MFHSDFFNLLPVLDLIEFAHSTAFQHGIIVIDNGIEQGVGEMSGARLANLTARGTNARPHWLEDVEVGLFLKSDEKTLAQKHADLLAAHLSPLSRDRAFLRR